VNDGAVLEDTLAGVLDEYAELASVAVVPLGVSRWSGEASMRPHTKPEAAAVIDSVAVWQQAFLAARGHRVVFAADEYYLLADRPFPDAMDYEGFPMHEDGIGMARAFEAAFLGDVDAAIRPRSGFFAAVDGAPAEGYRAPRTRAVGGSSAAESGGGVAVAIRPRRTAPIGILTGPLGAAVLQPLIDGLGRDDVRLVPVANEFFGGNIGVTGLLVGPDLARTLATEPEGHRYLLPDVCLTQGVFLDGSSPSELPRSVEIVSTDGASLRRALGVR
jgi:NifB/MoaA-like Fe-S oxidoreductase